MTKNPQSDIEADLVRACLNRVLASGELAASPKIGRFLRFIVDAKLAGQASRLKAYAIGVEVFERPPDFDPGSDSIVRVNAIRLRGLLDAYYAGEGRGDPLRFVVGKGSYVPEFCAPGCVEDSAPKREPPTGQGHGHIVLAVERLEPIGCPPEQDYLAAGLTEELVANLSAYGENLVVVRAPSAAGGESVDLAAPSTHSHDVSYHLRGSFRLHADQIRVGITLVDAATALVIWSETFAYRLSSASLFEIQEQIARRVASRVLDPHGALYRSLKRKPAAKLGTYLAVFRFNEYQERFSPESHLKAREALEQAVREEPGYAEAWAVLADVYLGEALFGFNQTLPLSSLIEKCVETALRAIALDPRNAMASYNLAMVLFYRGNLTRFLTAAEHALCLAPHRPDNLAVVGMHLALAGQWERGLALVQEAMDLNPFHPSWYHLAFSLHHLHFGCYHEALAAIGRFARLDFFPFQINLAVIHGHLGNRGEAREALRHTFALWPEARQRMHEILNFWFPFEDMAAVFADGLTKAGFPMGQCLDGTDAEPGLGVDGRPIHSAVP